MSLNLFSKFFIASLILFYSCKPEPVENKALEKQLLGEWQSKSLKLTMNSFSNKDTTRIFEVDESNWGERMNLSSIHTIYFGDGSYVSEHRNLKDSVIYAPAGRWIIMGDSLMLRDTFPQVGLSYSYKIEFIKNTAILNGIEDCDNDGSADDNYYGVLERQKNKSGK